MKYRVVWGPRANQDFMDTLSYLIDNVSDETAANLVLDVQRWLEMIADFPHICPLSKKGDSHKCVINKRYILIYSVVQTDIHITLFTDARSDHPY